MNIKTYLNKKQALIDAALKDCIPPAGTRPAVLHEAMRYCVLNGGKRIRPVLCLAAADAFGANLAVSLPPALAIEIFHCSTLIHDDLPCMDDDDLRRGLPTCHIKFGEANAVLTGDALMILAFQTLAETGDTRLVLELTHASGSHGVIAGQVEDLAAEGSAPSAELIDYIHANKTAALIRAAIMMGAMTGDADEVELDILRVFGDRIGLVFQIVDDILDETSTDEVLGKPTGSDQSSQKMTYPAVHGMDAAKKQVKELTREALDSLDSLSRNTEALRAIACYLVERTF